MKSRGYRKIAGDLCIGSGGLNFEPYEFTCCVDNAQPTNPSPSANVLVNNNKPLVTGLGIVLAIAIVVAMTMGVVAAIFVW